MPLRKRFAEELDAVAQENCIVYKDLQREAEQLVESPDEQAESALVARVLQEMARANTFFVARESEVDALLSEVRAAVECVAAMHRERLAKRRGAAGGAQPPPAPAKPPAAREDSPTSSTALLWAPRAAPLAADAAGAAEIADAGAAENERDDTDEEGDGGAARAATRAVAACFERWRREALGWRAPPPPPRALADYLGDEFLTELADGALRAALRGWLDLLARIDRARLFALLNNAAALKVAQRHCTERARAAIEAGARALPMWGCTVLWRAVTSMEQLADEMRALLFPGAPGRGGAPGTPVSWSPRVCPFCWATARNPVSLRPAAGRTCCWECAAGASAHASVRCPVTGRIADLRALRLERALPAFLRRFFPRAARAAPPELAGAAPAPPAEARDPLLGHRHGMLAAMRAAAVAAAPAAEDAAEMRERAGRGARARGARRARSGAAGPTDDARARLDAAVAVMLVKLGAEAGGGGSGGGSGGGALQRRERTASAPARPLSLKLVLPLSPRGPAGAPAGGAAGVVFPASAPADGGAGMWAARARAAPTLARTGSGGVECVGFGEEGACPGLGPRRRAAEGLAALARSEEG